jgi:hypothetical protein
MALLDRVGEAGLMYHKPILRMRAGSQCAVGPFLLLVFVR